MMQCPNCFGNTSVRNSRPQPDCVRRTRLCLSCGYVFHTVEMDEDMLKNTSVEKGEKKTTEHRAD